MSETAPKSSRPAARKWVALGVPVALAVAAGGGSLYQIHVRHRLGTVTEGKVYKSGTMPPAQMAKVARELGLRTVIDLRTYTPGQDSTNTTDLQVIQAEETALGSVGVRHIFLPTPQVPTAETVDRFLKVMNDPANLPTLIHCYHGIGRTELFVAVNRIEFEHWSNEKARGATRFLLAGSSFSDTAEKGQFLIHYRPHLAELTQAKN
jgi:protein tyrosine phosphatase (PTP) superfamily phosphohydrolase (DUF442 family)